MLRLQNRDFRELAVSPIESAITPDQKARAMAEVLSLPKSVWYRCEFRNCDLLLVYGGSAVLDKRSLDWLHPLPAIKQLALEIVNRFFNSVPRIIVLKTPPGQVLNWHVDCAEDETESYQPKLRVLLKGKPDDLYFMSSEGEKIAVKIPSDLYYMSGAYIHALENRSNEDRYVLCFGSPWNEKDIKPALLEAMNLQPQTHLLWNDRLKIEGRKQYVRHPKKHALVPYA